MGTSPRGTPRFTFPDYRTRWKWLPRQQLRSTPGSRALYSNVAFDFLSDALASAAHKRDAALLAERTLNPLHMRNTTSFPNPTQCARLLLTNHDEGPCAVTEATAAGELRPLFHPADMAIWLQYLLDDGAPGIPTQDPAAQAIYLLTF